MIVPPTGKSVGPSRGPHRDAGFWWSTGSHSQASPHGLRRRDSRRSLPDPCRQLHDLATGDGLGRGQTLNLPQTEGVFSVLSADNEEDDLACWDLRKIADEMLDELPQAVMGLATCASRSQIGHCELPRARLPARGIWTGRVKGSALNPSARYSRLCWATVARQRQQPRTHSDPRPDPPTAAPSVATP
jgi:hypothetical protein